jgi:succinate-acetate transporter protein
MTTETEIPEAPAAPVVEPPPPGDPAIVGVPTFTAASIALGLTLLGYIPNVEQGSTLPIVLAGASLGLLISTFWSAYLGQTALAGVFGVFASFWLSYAILLLGLTHGWYGVTADAVQHTVAAFLISWLVVIAALTVATLRLPSVFTALFTLVDVALLLILIGTLGSSTTAIKAAGVAVLGFAAIGVYLFINSAVQATGGRALPLGRALVH